MRFLTRGLFGAMALLLTLGLLALAAASLLRSIAAGEAEEAARPPGEERVFAVDVATLAPETVRPVITAYGEVLSTRQLELRAANGGRLVWLTEGFRDGGRVEAGETLFALDPADAQTALALAESDLAAAQAETEEARGALGLTEAELAASRRQRDLRVQALERARSLRERGNGIAADLEAAELALATAEQALVGREMALAETEARIARAVIAEDRAGIARDEAERRLADTRATAPFAGVLSEVAAVPGRLVGANEQLGLLIDPAALDVAFRVSNAEFARLTDAAGALRPLPVTAELAMAGTGAVFTGRIERAGAAVGEGETGRLVYARLEEDARGLLRPGDFLTVRIEEPALSGVAVVPAAALGPDQGLLVLGPEDRLEEVQVTLLRRQGDMVIIGDTPFGRPYVTARAPQLGPGVRVRPVAPAEPAEPMVRLSPERRAGLVAAVEAEGGIEPAARERLLVALEAEEVPRSLVDRLERRTGG